MLQELFRIPYFDIPIFGYGLMIFNDSLERYASVGIPSLLIEVCLVGLVVTYGVSSSFALRVRTRIPAAILHVSRASRLKALANWSASEGRGLRTEAMSKISGIAALKVSN